MNMGDPVNLGVDQADNRNVSVRALIVAELCNPEWVSVPLVGWSLYEALRRLDGVDAHLVTQVRNRDALVRAGLQEGRDFTAIDSEAVAGPVHRIGEWARGGAGRGWTTKMALNVFGRSYFERLLWDRMGHQIADRKFDVVHQITPLSPTLPARLATHCREFGVPFVWGPINGGLAWPSGFDDVRRAEGEMLAPFRPLVRFLPGYWRTREDASALLVGSRATWEETGPSHQEKAFYMPENAIDPKRFGHVRERRAVERVAGGEPLRMLFVGRLTPYKGCDMLIHAAAGLLRAGRMTLEVIGDGPQRDLLEALVDRLGVRANVRMAGWVEHQQVQHHYANADVFALPSIREFGGGVVLEAMAVGVPSMVVDYGGPAELVTDDTGWRVPMGRRDALIASLTRTLESIVADPAGVDQKGERALERAMARFTWDYKAERVGEVWRWVLGQGARPVMPMPW